MNDISKTTMEYGGQGEMCNGAAVHVVNENGGAGNTTHGFIATQVDGIVPAQVTAKLSLPATLLGVILMCFVIIGAHPSPTMEY